MNRLLTVSAASAGILLLIGGLQQRAGGVLSGILDEQCKKVVAGNWLTSAQTLQVAEQIRQSGRSEMAMKLQEAANASPERLWIIGTRPSKKGGSAVMQMYQPLPGGDVKGISLWETGKKDGPYGAISLLPGAGVTNYAVQTRCGKIEGTLTRQLQTWEDNRRVDGQPIPISPDQYASLQVGSSGVP